jgi:RHS repeat-associated protein
VATASVADKDWELVADQLAAAAGEDGRSAGETCALLLAALGRRPPDSEAVRQHAENDRGDAAHSYFYDAESRISQVDGTQGNCSTATVCYVYDGDGLRVKKSSGTLYWRSVWGDVLAESDSQGNITNEYVFFGGRRIARISSGTVNYIYSDALGTVHTITDATGNACYDASFTPYGQEMLNPNISQTCSSNYKFTGDEYDSETGLYYAKGRYYNPRLGRFMSVDPLAGDITNPQSLNRYAYVLNNPTTLTDPTGLAPGGCMVAQLRGGPRPAVTCDEFDDHGCMIDFSAVPCNLSGGPDAESPCPDTGCFGLGGEWECDIQNSCGYGMFDHIPENIINIKGDPNGNAPQTQQNCEQEVQAAAQNALGQPVNYIGPTPGTQKSNAYNFDFFAPEYTGGGAFNLCGRYLPPGILGAVTGIGPSLHIVSQSGFCNPLGDPSDTGMVPGGFMFTAHIDSAFGFNPIGFVYHEIVDVLLKSNHGC